MTDSSQTAASNSTASDYCGQRALSQATGEDLRQAALRGDVDRLHSLLNQGADPSSVNADGWTPLIFAAKEGHISAVEMLLAAGALPAAAIPKTHTPLRGAAMFGHLMVVQMLLAAGGDPNECSGNALTPLHGAVRSQHWDVAEALIRAGADVEARNAFGESAADLAIKAEAEARWDQVLQRAQSD